MLAQISTIGAGLELKEGDKGWLGAWWLGFVIVAALTAFISPFLGNYALREREDDFKCRLFIKNLVLHSSALFPQTLPSDVEMDAHKLEKKLEATEVKGSKSQIKLTESRDFARGKHKKYINVIDADADYFYSCR